MNSDQKQANFHDFIQAIGYLLAAIPASVIPGTWQKAVAAIPGVLTAAYGFYLSNRANTVAAVAASATANAQAVSAAAGAITPSKS